MPTAAPNYPHPKSIRNEPSPIPSPTSPQALSRLASASSLGIIAGPAAAGFVAELSHSLLGATSLAQSRYAFAASGLFATAVLVFSAGTHTLCGECLSQGCSLHLFCFGSACGGCTCYTCACHVCTCHACTCHSCTCYGFDLLWMYSMALLLTMAALAMAMAYHGTTHWHCHSLRRQSLAFCPQVSG